MRALLVLLFLFGVPFGLVLLALEDQPVAVPPVGASHEDVARLRDLLQRNDPRGLAPGAERTVVVAERELNLALAHGLARTGRLAGRVGLAADAADVALAARLPENPLGRYLNVTGRLAAANGRLAIERLSLGSVPVPAWLANPIAGIAHRVLLASEDYRLLTSSIGAIDFDPGTLRVALVWRPEVAARLGKSGRALFFPEGERTRLAAWSKRVDQTLASLPRSVSLAQALPPLFAEALRQPGDPAGESRALLLALGLQAAGKPAIRAARAAGIRAPSATTRLTLHGRWDLGRHFLVSAAAAVAADQGLADAAGLLKEIEDSRGGSGFSFADLAADRAGVRLAEALSRKATARRTQERLAGRVTEADFMPPIDGLAEGLAEADFRRRYGSPEDRRYLEAVVAIDRRIDARPLYR